MIGVLHIIFFLLLASSSLPVSSGDNDELTQRACGWTGSIPAIVDTPGYIRPPKYLNNNYMLNEECHWLARASPGQVTKVTFHSFDLETTFPCVYAFVKVYDADEVDEDEMIEMFCGHLTHGPTVFSSIHTMLIVFKSEAQGNGTGFEAFVDFVDVNSVACSSMRPVELDWDQGGFVSPDWPYGYPNGAHCRWRISTDKDVRLDFTDWNLRPPEEDGCRESVSLYNGPNPTSPLLGTYCGSHGPEKYGKTADKMLIVFSSMDYLFTYPGKFRVKFDSVNLTDEACGNEKPASIDWSPGFIRAPLTNVSDCEWRFNAPEGKVIRFTIKHFDLRECTNCGCSSLKIFDGLHFDERDLIGTYCRKGWAEEYIQTGGNEAGMKYESYSIYPGNGFTVEYTFYSFADHACSSNRPINLTHDYGIIASPNYDRGYYPNDVTCEWAVHTELGKIIEVHFLTFDLQPCPACLCDTLYIYNGYQPLPEREVRRDCDIYKPELFWTSLPGLYLRLVTDDDTSREGFKMEYEIKNMSDLACGEHRPIEIIMGPGDILSPNYGDGNYPQYLNCQWLLSTEYEKSVKLEFVDFHIEHDEPDRCQFDRLIVYDGKTQDALVLGTFCGNRLPDSIVSSTRYLLILFDSNHYIEETGFHLKFSHTDHPKEPSKARIIVPAVLAAVLALAVIMAGLVVCYKRNKLLKRLRTPPPPPRPPLRLDSLSLRPRNPNPPRSHLGSERRQQENVNLYVDIEDAETATRYDRQQSRSSAATGRSSVTTENNNLNSLLFPPSYQESQGYRSPESSQDCPPPTYEESLGHRLARDGLPEHRETVFGSTVRDASHTDELNDTRGTAEDGRSSRLWGGSLNNSGSRAEFDVSLQESINNGFIDDETVNVSCANNVRTEGQPQRSTNARTRSRSKSHDRACDQSYDRSREILRSHDTSRHQMNPGTSHSQGDSIGGVHGSLHAVSGSACSYLNESSAPKPQRHLRKPRSMDMLDKITPLEEDLYEDVSDVPMRRHKINEKSAMNRLSKSFDNIVYHVDATGASKTVDIPYLSANQIDSGERFEENSFKRRRAKSESNFAHSLSINCRPDIDMKQIKIQLTTDLNQSRETVI